ncbi:MAG: hypothetical protein Q7S27_07240 [Nanoarchaeota archaeon]|nr:hypothetical protein [Nanoarchaeota archaeon]
MTKREKRLEKGIASIEKQKLLHEEKKKLAQDLGQEDLVNYFTKEIHSLEKRKKNFAEKSKFLLLS